MFNQRLRQTLVQKLLPLLTWEQQKLLERFHYESLQRIFELSLIKDDIVYQLMGDMIGYPYRELHQENMSTALSPTLYKQHQSVLLDTGDLIMVDPLNLATKNYFSKLTNVQNIFLGNWSNIQKFIEQESVDDDCLMQILKEAIALKASDIHFNPEETVTSVQFRLNGVLRKMHLIPKPEWQKIIIRLKVKSRLDIAESRRPQSGRLSFFDDVDLRISTHPVSYGENIVIRVLDKSKQVHQLNNLGFEQFQVAQILKMLKKKSGLILVCGPTGSGKTTTLYSLISILQKFKFNIMTLEEPIEYKIPGIAQTEIIHDDIMSYADGIKSMMRQDLDVMLIGEIRDEKTAKMAFRAAFTGHLVLATLHTWSVESALHRLEDLGISKHFVDMALCGVIAQQLIRKKCIQCQGNGCEKCYFEGLDERQAIGEVLLWDDRDKPIVTMQSILDKKIQENITH